MALVDEQGELSPKDESFKHYYQTARWFYDRALHSCWLWWSSMRPHWSPNLIYKGLDLVMKTALNAQLALINLKIGDGDEYYSVIMDNMEKLMNELVEQELLGQRVRTLVSRTMQPGRHSVVWDGKTDDGSRVTSGFYFVTLRSANRMDSRRMILLK